MNGLISRIRAAEDQRDELAGILAGIGDMPGSGQPSPSFL